MLVLILAWRNGSNLQTFICSHYFLIVNHLLSELRCLFFLRLNCIMREFLSVSEMIGCSGIPSPLPVNAYWAWILQCLDCPRVWSVIRTLTPCYFCTNPVGVWSWVNWCWLFTGGSRRVKRYHIGGSCLIMGHYVGKWNEMLEEPEVSHLFRWSGVIKVTTLHKIF